MKLDLSAVSRATAVVAAVSYVMCAVVVAVAPQSFTQFVGYVAHADLSGLTRQLTWSSFFVGLVAWTVACVVAVDSTAWFYNRWARR